MNVVVQGSPLAPPLLDVEVPAGVVLTYDALGHLTYFMIVLPAPSGSSTFITSDLSDPNFAQIARSAGLKLSKSQ